MSWRVLGASAVGTSHTAAGRSCQDSCWAQVGSCGAGLPYLTLFVADGAGSAAKGGDAAELAIEAAVAFFENHLAQAEFSLTEELAASCVVYMRERIFAQAQAQGRAARDFACAFLGVVSHACGTLVLQIGDGGIAVDVGAGLEVSFLPRAGEYASGTSSLADEDALGQLVAKAYPGPAARVAVFSDGLQGLALNLGSNMVYEPFFAPFFTILAAATLDQEDELNATLHRFLQSPAVNKRTEDDKTLTLAVFTG